MGEGKEEHASTCTRHQPQGGGWFGLRLNIDLCEISVASCFLDLLLTWHFSQVATNCFISLFIPSQNTRPLICLIIPSSPLWLVACARASMLFLSFPGMRISLSRNIKFCPPLSVNTVS